jgi:hypothetical protein
MPKPLPPTVGERLVKCGTSVDVWGIYPGSDVILEVNGTPQTQMVSSTATTITVSPLPVPASVRAQQRVGLDTSDWSNVIPVEDVLLPPSPPSTERTIPSCAGCLAAWGSAPGSRIEITSSGTLVAEGVIDRNGLACMGMKVRPPALMESAAVTCGTPSPTKGTISIYDAPPVLPPPVLVDPIFECQSRILLDEIVPGATIEVFVTDNDGVTSSLGTFCACSSRVNAYIGRVIKHGDRLKAIQRMENDKWECHITGKESIEVSAVPPDPILNVTNQIEGGTITLLSRSSATAPEEDLGIRPSSEFPEVPFPNPPHADQVLRVQQELCGVKEVSEPVTVQKRPPVIGPPSLRKLLFGCGEVVAVDNVIPGAWVYVRQTPPGLMSPEYLIGKARAFGSSVVVPVYPLLQTDAFVTAYQEVGGKLSSPASWVKVKYKTEFGPPTIVPPAIAGTKFVWLDDVVPGAHIRIFDRGIQIGSGALPDIDGTVGLWWTIPDKAILTVTQGLCKFESRPSSPRPAVSGASCEGSPPYDPAKWNDGGQAQGCNNCYNYACDIRTDNFAQPGGDTSPDCAAVKQGALKDGLKSCTTSHCHPCHHRVALVVAPGFDYHWYRQHVDGMWSHKPGCTEARNVDNSNNPISDPAIADRGPYTDFCGYFCLYKPDVSIKGPGCKCWP